MPQFTGTDLVCFRGERTVFAGLGFALDPGGAILLRGPNGSGKSSLLRLMAGLARPFSGSIQWDGENIDTDPEAHNANLHYVGHADPVKPVLTVGENLGFWASMKSGGKSGGKNGGGETDIESAVRGALGQLGIGHLESVPGRFLSAGQKRRVNLARLLAAEATLWLLDEPATALDRAAVESLDNAIQNHRSGGGMVVISTHAVAAQKDAAVIDLGEFQEGQFQAIETGAP